MANGAWQESNRLTLSTSSDLSASQYCIAKLSSGKIALSSAATDKHIGIIEINPNGSVTADDAVVRLLDGPGTFLVAAGGTISVGDYLTANASGQAVATTTGGDQVVGMALEAGVTGQFVEFLPYKFKYA